MLGPIFHFELLRSARGRHGHAVRILYSGLIATILWLCLEGFGLTSRVTPQAAAQFSLAFLSWLLGFQLVTSILLSCTITAGAILEERERGTLDHLLTTDLRNWEIVAGKTAGRVVRMSMVVVSAAPLTIAASWFGGVEPWQVAQLWLATLSTVLLTVVITLGVSSTATRRRDVILRAILLVAGLFTVPLLIVVFGGWAPALYGWVQPVNDLLLDANPFLQINMMPGPFGSRTLGQLLTVQLAASVSLGLLLTRRLRRSQPAQQEKSAPARADRRPLLNNAILWKELYVEKSLVVSGASGVVGGVIAFAAIAIPLGIVFQKCWTGAWETSVFRGIIAVVGTVIAMATLLVVALRCATTFSSEREKQTWELLTLTDLRPREFVLGKLCGALYSMRLTILVIACLWLTAALLEPFNLVRGLLVVVCIVLVSPIYAVVGINLSLCCRSSNRAILFTMMTMVLLAGGYTLLWPRLLLDTDSQVALALCTPWLFIWPTAGEQHILTVSAATVAGIGCYILAALALGYLAIWQLRSSLTRIRRRSPAAAQPAPMTPARLENG